MRLDRRTKRLERYPDVAADIINAVIYGGAAYVKPENIEQIPTQEGGRDEDGETKEWTRDLLFIDRENDTGYAFYGIENQSDIDNTMPLRSIELDCARYRHQVERFMEENRKNKNPAYNKTIHEYQKLTPVITIVLYYGEEWTGPRSLLDMVDVIDNELLAGLLMDYKMNLVELRADRTFADKLHSDFKYVAGLMSRKGDIQAVNEFIVNNRQNIEHPEELLDVLEVVSGKRYTEKVRKSVRIRKEKGEVIDMWCMEDEWLKEGRKEGRKEGCVQGRIMKTIDIVYKKMLKGYDVAKIADMIEEDESLVSRIYEIVKSQLPDYDELAVYEELQKVTIE